MEVIGKVKQICQIQIISEKLQKRSMILETDEKYTQTLEIEFINANCQLLDNYKEGNPVKVGVNLRGRAWVNPEGVTKYFNSIQGWKISNTIPEVNNNIQNEARQVANLPF
tara:strand:- start:731 stop:1063 length:333 start_codon:yes stop_codon:yes gene_type:complete